MPDNVAMSIFLGKALFIIVESIMFAHKIRNKIIVINEMISPNKMNMVTLFFFINKSLCKTLFEVKQ